MFVKRSLDTAFVWTGYVLLYHSSQKTTWQPFICQLHTQNPVSRGALAYGCTQKPFEVLPLWSRSVFEKMGPENGNSSN